MVTVSHVNPITKVRILRGQYCISVGNWFNAYSGPSHKHSTTINYESRVVLIRKLQILRL